MTEANFWFDKIGDCKDPERAVNYLAANADKEHTLSEAVQVAGLTITGESPHRTISLGKWALLMMGITKDLQEALRKDYLWNSGIQTVVTPNTMRLWYVRRGAGSVTKTVAIVASWPDYWNSTMPPAINGINWHDLWPDKGITPPDTTLKVSVLHDIVPKGQDKKADFSL